MACAISTVVLTVIGAMFVNCRLVYLQLSDQLESTSMVDNLVRTVEMDVHAANGGSVFLSELVLQEMSGVQYTYFVNSSNQLIRSQAGGGTAVISAHVKSVQASVDDGIVNVTATWLNGKEVTVRCLLGEAMGQS
ncbi:hypothetical protein [Alicyclobacillus acidiphilus]|uniref:hypothetical protein n=1 Tax=Alicyclobacillus acidiphilus TaxID=182455 RepID=UPI00082D6217|nr:hypothetical protein [Alicyclobacillus acidiphilus]